MSRNKGRDMHPANLVHDTTWIAKTDEINTFGQ